MNELAREFGDRRNGRRFSAIRRLAILRLAAAWIRRQAWNLDPGYFALVMATGIVSNALFLEGQRALSDALFAVNLLAYPWLWLLTITRAFRCTAAMWADLINARRVFLFFTAVAATDVLAMSVALRGGAGIALALWLLALALWLALIYVGFGVLLLHNSSRNLDVIEGAWLNAIVGTQSLVIVGGAAALPAAAFGAQAFIVLDMFWIFGLILYAILIVLLCQRFFFSQFGPDQVGAPLWIVMGAAAITVNAGTILILDGGATSFLRALDPFLSGATLGAWAWATWWIPLLLLLGVWKHGLHGRSMRYTPIFWSIVFPLGMYSAATLRLASVTATPLLGSLASAMTWIALAAWCATAFAFIAAALRNARALIGIARFFGAAAAHRRALTGR
ncbi:MAG: tellurite resistance/C4-dicarboxylate transporter family protein [Xanthobacteraceae bacterium]